MLCLLTPASILVCCQLDTCFNVNFCNYSLSKKSFVISKMNVKILGKIKNLGSSSLVYTIPFYTFVQRLDYKNEEIVSCVCWTCQFIRHEQYTILCLLSPKTFLPFVFVSYSSPYLFCLQIIFF